MANRGSVLAVNDYLRTNDSLVSANGQFFAIMQSDGNLCVYEGTPDNVGNFRWGWTDWSRNQDDYFTVMQSDGNLCVYWGSSPNDNRGFLWSALSDSAREGQYFAIMQDDGNLCVYRGTEPSVEGYVWSWMDAYSHLFRESPSFFDTIGNGVRSAANAVGDFGRQTGDAIGAAAGTVAGEMESSGKAAWQATSETASGLAEGAARAGVTVSDSFIAGAEATRSALETGAEVTRQGLVGMGHYINQHACSIAVGSTLTSTITGLASSGAGLSLIGLVHAAAAQSSGEAALRSSADALAHLLAEPVSKIPIPGFSHSKEEIQTVIAFIIVKSIPKGGASGGAHLKFWAGAIVYGLTEFICSGKLPGGYSVWEGAQAQIPAM
jgi:hypothetical protein